MIRGWRVAFGALFNEGGPWGGSSGGGSGGGDDESGGGRNPWRQPPGGRPGKPRGPSALDEFLRRAKTGLPENLPGGGRSLWGYAVIGVVALWLAFTCLHSIDPQQRGVVTRLGAYSRTLEPGVSLTLPAPFEQVQTIDVRIKTTDIPDGSGEKLVLTGDQNIIDLDYSVRWSIKSPELYLFQLADPDSTITAVAESAMRAVIANVSLTDAMGPGRTGIEAEVQQRMQMLLDKYRAGVRIQGVAIKRADPPDAVNDAFKEVTAAQQQAQANINNANAQAQQVIAGAQGDAAAFDRVYSQYKLAPEVTRRRMYYETMEQVLSRVDKTIVESGGVTPYLPLGKGARAIPPVAQGGAQP